MSSKDKTLSRRVGASDVWYRQLLGTVTNVKLGWFLTALLFVAVVAHVVSFRLSQLDGDTYAFLSGFSRLMADASMSAAIVGFAYEWLVRRETSQALRLMYESSLREHEASVVNAVVREIPRALLLDKDVQRSVLVGPGKVDEIIQGALRVRLGDEEMSGSIYDGLLQKTFSYTERYADLRVEVMLSNVSDDEPEEVRRTFYDAVVTLRYRTKLNTSRFIFTRALDHDQFNARARDPAYVFTWRLEESEGLPRDSERALDLYRMSVDDLDLPRQTRISDDGAYEIVCEDPALEEKRDTEVTIHYAVMTKLRRHDHVFFYSTVRPTRGITVIFNFARTDIAKVLTYDFFVSSRSPVIYELPRGNPHTVIVELDEWVFPKGGVAFVWRLEGEGQ